MFSEREYMDKNEKKRKKALIRKKINLSNGRFKDNEIDFLYDVVSNPKKYNVSRTIKNTFSDFSSDGKYTRNEETVFSIKTDGDKIVAHKDYSYKDDDGQNGVEPTQIFDNARAIIDAFKTIKGI
jgi:hypothetical protein